MLATLLAFAPVILLVIKALAPVAITAIGAWATYRADRYVKAKTDNEVIPAALHQFFDVVLKAVLVVQQTYVDDLIEKSADGKLTESEKRQALAKAGELVIKQLPPQVEELLRAYFGARFAAVIETEIEAAVAKTKTYSANALLTKAKRSQALTEMRAWATTTAADRAKQALAVVADPDKKK